MRMIVFALTNITFDPRKAKTSIKFKNSLGRYGSIIISSPALAHL